MDAAVVTPIVTLVIGWGLSQVTDTVRGRRDDRRERLLWRRQALVDLQPLIIDLVTAISEMSTATQLRQPDVLNKARDAYISAQARLDIYGQRIADPEFRSAFSEWQRLTDPFLACRTVPELEEAVRIWSEQGAVVYNRLGQLIRDT